MRFAGTALCGALLAVSGPLARASDFAEEAFIEFLGSFDDGEGNWLDPLELLQIDEQAPVRKDRLPVSTTKQDGARDEETDARSEKYDDN